MGKTRNNIFFKYAFLTIFIAIIGIVSLFSAQNFEITLAAQGSTIPAISDSHFTFKMEAVHRKKQKIYYDSEVVTTTIGENITFYKYDWSLLDYLDITISPTLEDGDEEIETCTLSVSHKQTEDIHSTSEMKTRNLFVINTNLSAKKSIKFYVDSKPESTETDDKKFGSNYGLYRFDFTYTYKKDDVSGHKKTFSTYIAVLPDKIDDILINNLKINYSVASSNKLMNIFNLSINKQSSFAYINPTYIQWKVVGKDVNGVEYVLTEEMKNDPEYANCKVIWNATQQVQTSGTNFVFDSNDIEGTWTAYCTILKDDGVTERTTIKSETLSTIKVERKSYALMIILIVMGVVLVGSVVGLIIYVQKKKKSM